jgi:class 3 adenylate cyclase
MVRRDEEISKIKQEKDQVDSLARIKDKLVASLTKEQILARLRQAELSEQVQTEKAKVAESEVARQKSENMRNVLALLSGIVLLLALLFYFRFRAKRRTANALAEKNVIIEAEQQKIDALLLNILPPAIANELKARNKVAARQYPKATVMFIDFKGFTKVAENLSPEGLVELLDYCFTNFDRIISRYNIEKIKTVGDAYICASGLSDKNASPSDMVRAALEIQDFLLHTRAARMDKNLPFFEARVGIHTGPVVAGVVGEKKFAYDIWGDTVNTAARMEEACDTGRVNVSEDAYWLAKYEFEWEFRGKIAAKNKGLMDMYYVTAIKQY